MSWQPPLVEVGPSRRLRAAGATWWGVDPSTVRVSIGVAEHGAAHAHTASFGGLTGPERLAHAYALTRGLAQELALEKPPGLVVVEQPSGSHQNLELVYAVGAIMAGLHAGCEAVCAWPRFETITSGQWKKQLLGYGGIRKPKPKEVREGATYAVLDWARETCGYAGSVWDEADALAIACWARQDVLLEAS